MVSKKRKVLESSQSTQNVRSSQAKRMASMAIRPNRNFPLPSTITVPMRYVEFFALDAPIGTPTYHTFSANGLYDPNVTGTGHQPMGFDQMMTLYNHYEVIGSKITFRLFGTATCIFGVKLDDSGLPSTSDPISTWELPLMNCKHLANGNSNGTSDYTVTQKFSQKRFFGEKAGDRETWGDGASNPTDQAYFLCMIGPNSTSGDLASVQCMATIDYIVKLHEPKDFVPS